MFYVDGSIDFTETQKLETVIERVFILYFRSSTKIRGHFNRFILRNIDYIIKY